MSVRQQKRRDPTTGATRVFWMIDIDYEHPDGRRERVRKVSPVQNRRGAEQYERELRDAIVRGLRGKEEKTVPTLGAFADEFIATYAETNNKPSEVASKRSVLKHHLVPAFGRKTLDAIGVREMEVYKSAKLRSGLSPKTVNNQLTVLHRVLVVAAEWRLITHVPPMKWLKAPEPEFDFLTFDEARRLVESAEREATWGAMVLTGLRTGLRQGELLALRWDDLDLVAGRLVVRRAVARGIVGTPKNGKSREIPLGEEVLRALKSHRHLRGELVFTDERGDMLTKEECKHPLWRACRRAGLRRIGWHVLRHSFASHLVMRGAPMKAVQELLGHSTMEMTMRYAHLSPDVRRDAVRLLDEPNGNLTATGGSANGEAQKTG
ncbi:MAG: site-specific integrase [Deltaproteobacteria bacterium]|nr:site-specific integrase [Deltaproteobacteria bacterium]